MRTVSELVWIINSSVVAASEVHGYAFVEDFNRPRFFKFGSVRFVEDIVDPFPRSTSIMPTESTKVRQYEDNPGLGECTHSMARWRETVPIVAESPPSGPEQWLQNHAGS